MSRKILAQKWFFLIVLLLSCSFVFFSACGDQPKPQETVNSEQKGNEQNISVEKKSEKGSKNEPKAQEPNRADLRVDASTRDEGFKDRFVPEKQIDKKADDDPSDSSTTDKQAADTQTADTQVKDTRTKEQKSPDKGITCAKEGDKIAKGQSCCKGLKSASSAKIPMCNPISGDKFCIRCGDNKCDTASGEDRCNCPQDCGASCKAQKDCAQKLACKDVSQGCQMYGIGCLKGKCAPGKAPVQKGMRCNKNLGYCQPIRRCSSDTHCLGPLKRACQDTKQGCMLISARCLRGFCEFGYGPPNAKAQCNSQAALCVKKGTLCRKTIDCFPGGKQTYTCTTHSQGGCNNITKACYKGQCIRSSGRAAGYLCNPVTKQCAKNLCKSSCDCPIQGQACVKGACANASTASFCCSKKGCPMGQACTKKDGKSGICATPASCTATKDCGVSYCKNTNAKTCQEYLPECSNGKCAYKAPTTHQLSQCNPKIGRCKGTPCTSHGNCGKSSCKMTTESCIQTTPACRDKSCQLEIIKTSAKAASCDIKSGTCKARSCTKSGACGKPQCSTVGNECVQKTSLCLTGRKQCKIYTSRVPSIIAPCNKSTGYCMAKTCAKASDCNAKIKACKMTGFQVCIQYKQACYGRPANACMAHAHYFKTIIAACNSKTGNCQYRSCRSTANCPKACQMTSKYCVQQSSYCTGSKCKLSKTVNFPKSYLTCNAKKGQCLCKFISSQCRPQRCEIRTVGRAKYCHQFTYSCHKGGPCVEKRANRGIRRCVSGRCR